MNKFEVGTVVIWNENGDASRIGEPCLILTSITTPSECYTIRRPGFEPDTYAQDTELRPAVMADIAEWLKQ